MFQEISAAVDHLLTLLHPAVDATNFRQQVQSTLETRFARLWFPENPIRASASRVLLWHAHGGGEGLDKDIHQACLDNCKLSLPNAELFCSPFTLWIDPGCVAIRLGHGPGLSFTPGSSLLSNIKVIYSRQEQRSSHFQAPPMLALIPSTPAIKQGWSESNNVEPTRAIFSNYHHTRSPSASSMASSVTGSRSISQSSSYMSSADDNEQCPSLTAQDSDSELSIEDMIDSGCYKNFDVIDDADDDDQRDVGDETITENIRLQLADTTIDASAPSSIVNYDGGNVGVLGGGIRLGGGAAIKAKQPLPSPPALPSPNLLHGYEHSLEFPDTQYHTMMEGYAIPMAKRIRSRGRRSRGRGAGRAARRQAAVIQGIELSPEINDYDSKADRCEDERIMAIVRQRADQIASDLIKRQTLQSRRSVNNLHQQYYPSQPHQYQVQHAMPMQHHSHHPLPSHHPYQLHSTPLYQSMN